MSTRDVEQDPRVGDVVQPILAICDAEVPSRLTITAVTDRFVEWERDGEKHMVTREFWRGDRILPGQRLRLVLVEAITPQQEAEQANIRG